MAFGRSKCVIGDMTPKKVMPHEEFVSRIRKTLYYGRRTSYQGMAVSRPLAMYASELFSEPHKGYSLNRLTEEFAGGVNASPCALIMALIYLDRLSTNDPSYVRRITPSELFIVSLVISTKFYWEIDEQHFLKTCAREGNLTEDRIKELELQFLFAIDWNINISEEEFFQKLTHVETTIARREGIKRGWLTYTELLNLLPSFTIAKFLLNNFAVMAVSYAASVMTIAGAFFLVSHITGNSTLTQNSTDTQLNSAEILDAPGSSEILSTQVELRDTRLADPIDIDVEMKKLEEEYRTIVPNVETNQNTDALSGLSKKSLMTKTQIHADTQLVCYNFMEKEYCEAKNGTRSTFWNLLREGENVFVQIPFIWFKFI